MPGSQSLEQRVADAEARLREAESLEARIGALDEFTDGERAAVRDACELLRQRCGELRDSQRRRETVVDAQIAAVRATMGTRESVLNEAVAVAADDLFPIFRDEHARLQREERALQEAHDEEGRR